MKEFTSPQYSLILFIYGLILIGCANDDKPSNKATTSKVERDQSDQERDAPLQTDSLPVSDVMVTSKAQLVDDEDTSDEAGEVPDHVDLEIPEGPEVKDTFTSEKVNILPLESSLQIVSNRIALPAGRKADQVAEPTVACKDDTIFYTSNHFAAVSVNGGRTFQYVSPKDVFKGTGFSFCCDQIAIYVPQINMFIWSLQATNGKCHRLLYASPANMVAGKWKSFNLTPKVFGEEGRTVDFPDMTYGRSMFYFSTNIFGSGKSASAAIIRIPLENFQTGKITPLAVGKPFGVRFAQNSDTVCYFARQYNTSRMRIYSWRESKTTTTFNDVNVPSYKSTKAWGLGGAKVRSGTRTGNELWFAWNAGPRGNRPKSYVQVARIDATSFRLLGSPDIWSEDHKVGVPALGTNLVSGEVGISYSYGKSHHHAVGLLSPTPIHATSAEGDDEADGKRWGDYVIIRQNFRGGQNPQPTNELVATGYTYEKVQRTNTLRLRPRVIFFGRRNTGTMTIK